MYERRRHQPTMAPVTIFPLGDEAITDILLGLVHYSVGLSGEAIEAAFAQRGITARCATSETWDEDFLTARRGVTTVTVPGHAREQMLQEAMTTGTLVSIVEAMLNVLDAGAADSKMVFCDETRTWLAPTIATAA